MQPPVRTDDAERALARELASHVADADRPVLLHWARRMGAIRAADTPPLGKVRDALEATYRAEVALALLSGAGRSIRDIALGDRSWGARLGLGAAAVGALAVGAQGAGIAALGGAVGVPLWMVLGAGGRFAGMLVDELERARGAIPRTRPADASVDGDVVDAEWEFAPADEQPAGILPPPDGAADAPLWSVFRRAWRDARRRQRETGGGPP